MQITLAAPSGNLTVSEKPIPSDNDDKALVPANSSVEPIYTHDLVLRTIIGKILHPILRREHLKREVIIGLVGLRGDGKSGSGAVIALLDYMMNGDPVWSNMLIKARIRVEDERATAIGLHHGGVVTYQSLELDKEGLLRFDPKYHDGCYFVDEINMEFAEARRAMSNTNLFMDRVAQQLRKYQNSMIYTVINEMFVDSRIRELTDIFIRCEDTALSIDGLENKKPTGIDFKWTIYPMSGYLLGRERSYYATKKPMPPVYLHFEPWRGIYNDKQAQAQGKMKYGFQLSDRNGGDMEPTLNGTELMTESQRSKELLEEWGWLETIVNERMMSVDENGGVRELVPQDEVMDYPEIKKKGYTKAEVTTILKQLFNIRAIFSQRGQPYRITQYVMPLKDQLVNGGEGMLR